MSQQINSASKTLQGKASATVCSSKQLPNTSPWENAPDMQIRVPVQHVLRRTSVFVMICSRPLSDKDFIQMFSYGHMSSEFARICNMAV